ncbi:MAG: ATP-binding protein [Ignavibacteriaceae bacterium]
MKRKNESETPLQNVSSKINSGQQLNPTEIKCSEENLLDNNINCIIDGNEVDFIGSTYSGLSVYNNLLMLEQRVRERTSELESFTHAVSHDLRAPIRCINRFSQALIKDYGNILDDTGKKYLKTICNKSQQMGNLVNTLLSFFITGHKELNKTELNIGTIVDGIINELKLYNQNELNFIRRNVLVPAFGDGDLIKIVLSNLISNAIKFSQKGPNPEIIIGSYKTKNETVFYIKDNGEGFNMEHADKLFSAFQRLHKSDEFEGTGIGLSIVERVINRHGGKVWAEGKIKEGATFYFSLPVVIEN